VKTARNILTEQAMFLISERNLLLCCPAQGSLLISQPQVTLNAVVDGIVNAPTQLEALK
jgi:hypothetical protein